MQYLLILAAVGAGMLIPVQTGFNTQLGAALGSPWSASAIVMMVAAFSMTVLAFAARAPLPLGSQLATMPWTGWLGGLLGAIYVLALIQLAPKLGAANLVVFVVVGQLLMALVIDHFGLIGFAEKPITMIKLFGALLLVGGAGLIRFA
jgi:bacterial/archaeal transporter family-2 protein